MGASAWLDPQPRSHSCRFHPNLHLCSRSLMCVCWPVWEQVELPGRGSCLGQFPRGDENRSSSSSASVAWTPTSTGLRLRRELRAGVRARPGEGEGGLSRPRPTARHDGPWHRFLLCSMKSRMSPKGKVAWHWPQVSRSCSREGWASWPNRASRPTVKPRWCPLRLPLSSECSEQRSDSSSDETIAVERGSAAGEAEVGVRRERESKKEKIKKSKKTNLKHADISVRFYNLILSMQQFVHVRMIMEDCKQNPLAPSNWCIKTNWWNNPGKFTNHNPQNLNDGKEYTERQKSSRQIPQRRQFQSQWKRRALKLMVKHRIQ